MLRRQSDNVKCKAELSPGHRDWVNSPRCLWNKCRVGSGDHTPVGTRLFHARLFWDWDPNCLNLGDWDPNCLRRIHLLPPSSLHWWDSTVLLSVFTIPGNACSESYRFLGLPISSWKTIGFSTRNIADNTLSRFQPLPLNLCLRCRTVLMVRLMRSSDLHKDSFTWIPTLTRRQNLSEDPGFGLLPLILQPSQSRPCLARPHNKKKHNLVCLSADYLGDISEELEFDNRKKRGKRSKSSPCSTVGPYWLLYI